MTNRAFHVRAVFLDLYPASQPEWQTLDTADFLKAGLAHIGWLYAQKLKIALFNRDAVKVVTQPPDGVPALYDFSRAAGQKIALEIETLSEVISATAADLGIPAGKTVAASSRQRLLSAAHRAGAVTVALHPHTAGKDSLTADYSAASFAELEAVIRLGLPLYGGKLPNSLLARYFSQVPFADPALLVRPGVGEDTAAVDISDEEVLVIKTDPITFASDALARYVVLVNANDIATSGAVPRWLLTTLIFPPGSTASEILQVMEELRSVSRRYGITLCGGHTEISDAVRRPVVTGMLAGTVMRRDLVDKRRMQPGDRIFMTKALAVEGTALIAREFGDRLRKLGVSDTEIERCQDFLEHISILTEASVAARLAGVSAMHDVTEGGLATALTELSWAGECRLKVDMDVIPVFPETRRACDLLGIDPLGLIGSGSLLICCRPADGNRLVKGVQKAGIAITCIGEVLEKGRGVQAVKHARRASWPQFEADEITRLYGGS